MTRPHRIWALVALAAVLTAACGGEEAPPTDAQPPYTGPLPPVHPIDGGPPEAVGSVSGFTGTGCRAHADCLGGVPAVVDLARLAAPEEQRLPDGIALGDGRSLVSTPTGGTAPWGERGMPEWWLVNPDETRVSLGAGFLETATALPDGRIAAVWTPMTSDAGPELRTVDSGGAFTGVDVPDGFTPRRLAAGPDGWYAALGTEDPCCGLHLLLVGPDGAQRRLVLHGRDADVAGGPIELSWGAAGLIAVSPWFPDHWEEQEGTTWATVVDPRAGEVVATIDDALGTAWSPDGTTLLLGEPTGPDTTRLTVAWGAQLAERTDLGTVPAAFTPHTWDGATAP